MSDTEQGDDGTIPPDPERAAFAAEDADQRSRGMAGYPADGVGPVGGPSPGALGAAFAELSSVLFRTEPGAGVAGVLSRVVNLGVQVVPAADLVSVTLRRSRDGSEGYATPVESDPLAAQLDQTQYDYGEGPCVTALEAGGLGTASSADLAVDATWPRFGPAAAALGAGSVFSVGLFPAAADGCDPLRGALNFYRRAAGPFADTDRETVLLLASHVSVALAYVAATDAAELRQTQFRTALSSRDVIGQAKGILMERRGVGADEAFGILKRASQDLNVKLHQVAATLAEHRTQI